MTGRGSLEPSTPPFSMALLTCVSLGATAGALARWAATDWQAGDWQAGGWPWATLVVNATGCLALGLLVARLDAYPRWSAFWGPGVLGGFTSVSAWSEQVRDLANSGHLVGAVCYFALTLAACLGAAAAGRQLSRGA